MYSPHICERQKNKKTPLCRYIKASFNAVPLYFRKLPRPLFARLRGQPQRISLTYKRENALSLAFCRATLSAYGATLCRGKADKVLFFRSVFNCVTIIAYAKTKCKRASIRFFIFLNYFIKRLVTLYSCNAASTIPRLYTFRCRR